MIYDVRQSTTYHYASPVAYARHTLRLTPIDREGQRVHAAALDITPVPVERREGSDFFGNRLHIVQDSTAAFAGQDAFLGANVVVDLWAQANVAAGAETVADFRHGVADYPSSHGYWYHPCCGCSDACVAGLSSARASCPRLR